MVNICSHLALMPAPFLPFDLLVDFLEVQFVVICVREHIPDINNAPFIVHSNDESVVNSQTTKIRAPAGDYVALHDSGSASSRRAA